MIYYTGYGILMVILNGGVKSKPDYHGKGVITGKSMDGFNMI